MNVAEKSLDRETPVLGFVPPTGARAMRSGMRSGEPPTDAELRHLMCAVAAAADRQAFAVLFQCFAPRLKTYLMRSHLAANMAEELAQETMLTVWRKASYFDPSRASVATWIYTIARNIRIDYLRRARHLRAVPDDLVAEQEAPSAETLVMADERDARVRAALANLSPEQAVVVRLSFFSEKPHAEIAQELGIPLGTVKSRVRLALSRLRAVLDDMK
jgi:RNA polymerase sigma-70 factor (ECF subfamily)